MQPVAETLEDAQAGVPAILGERLLDVAAHDPAARMARNGKEICPRE